MSNVFYAQSDEQIYDQLKNEWDSITLDNSFISLNQTRDSISPILLESKFIHFWEKKYNWNSVYIFNQKSILYYIFEASFKTIFAHKLAPDQLYFPVLQLSLDSMYVSDINIYSAQDLSEQSYLLRNYSNQATNLKDANEQMILSSESYKNAQGFASIAFDLIENNPATFANTVISQSYLSIYAISNLYGSPLIAFSSIVTSPTKLISYFKLLSLVVSNFEKSLDYSYHWQTTIENQYSAISKSAETMNFIFEDVQKDVAQLKKMGVDHPSYSGGARDSYIRYQNFVSLASSDILKGSNCSVATQDYQKYSCAYTSLTTLRTTSVLPGSLPRFDLLNSNLSYTYNLLTSPAHGSLLRTAINFKNSLSNSITTFNSEITQSKNMALKTGLDAKLFSDYINSNDSLLVSDSDDFENIQTLYLSASSQSGTISQLKSKLDTLLLQAESACSDANEVLNSKPNNYGAIALFHYKNCTFLYSQAYQIAYSLNESISIKTTNVCDNARSQAKTLESKLNSLNSGSSNSLFANISVSFLNRARTNIVRASQENSIGKKYGYCKSSISDSKQGIIALDSSETLLKNKTISDAIYVLESFVKASSILDHSQSSTFKQGYESIKSRYDSGIYVSESEIQSQINTIHHALNFNFEQKTKLYNEIYLDATAISNINPKLLYELDNLFLKYRTNNMWSLHAFTNEKSLDSLLQTAKKKTTVAVEDALKTQLCNDAQFISRSNSISIQTRSDIGGVWKSQNALNVNLSTPFVLSCPFGVAFANEQLTHKSQNVLSAFSSGSLISIHLNSISASDTIQIEFSSSKISVASTQKSCNAKISSSGLLTLNSQYALSSSHIPKSLIVSVAWPRHSYGTAILKTNDGQISDGVWSADSSSNPKIDFTIAQFSKDTDFYSIEISDSQPMVLEKKNYSISATDSKSGWLKVSYILSIENLSTCEKTELTIVEDSGSKIDNLQLSSSSNEFLLSTPKLNYVGQTTWSTTISSAKPVFNPFNTPPLVYVSYEVSNPSQWLNYTLLDLRHKAYLLNDSNSLSLIDYAQTAFFAGREDEAYKTISTIQSRLSAQVIDQGDSRKVLESELIVANQSLEIISNLNTSIFKDSKSWSKSLSSSIQKAQSLWDQGKLEEARLIIRTESNALNQKMLDGANSLVYDLSQKSNAVEQSVQVLNYSFELIPYTQSLNLAQDFLCNSNYAQALEHLSHAHNSLSTNYDRALSSAHAHIDLQDSQKISLQSQSNIISLDYERYTDWLSQLSSSNYLATPSLSSKETKSIQASLEKLLSTYKSEKPKTLENSLSKINQNSIDLENAKTQLDSYNLTIKQAFLDFEQLAQSTLSSAQMSVATLEKKNPQSQLIQTLTLDLSSSERMLNSKNYADSISLSDAIIKKASSATSSVSSSSSFPIEIIVVSGLFVALAVYLLLQKPPAQKKPNLITKSLQKSQDVI